MKPQLVRKIQKYAAMIGGVGLLVVLGCGVFINQAERIQMMSMQALLINISMAEETYYHTYHNYTEDWKQILANMDELRVLHTKIVVEPNQPQVAFVSFGDKQAQQKKGYLVSLQVENDLQQGKITAQRVGSGWFKYSLHRPFLEGDTQCENIHWAGYFCRQFIKQTEKLEVRNLVRVPAADNN